MALKLNFAQFQKELEKEIKEKRDILQENAKELVLTTYNEIMKESPVDTGFFRANNFVTFETRTNQVLESDPVKIKDFYKQTGNDLLKVTSDEINRKDFFKTKKIFIQNNLDYASYIENGSSGQAPKGVYSVSYELARAEIEKQKRQSV